jgi:hypothetical protein
MQQLPLQSMLTAWRAHLDSFRHFSSPAKKKGNFNTVDMFLTFLGLDEDEQLARV